MLYSSVIVMLPVRFLRQRIGGPLCRPSHKVHSPSVIAGAFVATNGILKLQHPGFSDERTVPAVLLLAQSVSARQSSTRRISCGGCSPTCPSEPSAIPGAPVETARGRARPVRSAALRGKSVRCAAECRSRRAVPETRSEEHTSELQSLTNLVCRLLLEKKNKKKKIK